MNGSRRDEVDVLRGAALLGAVLWLVRDVPASRLFGAAGLLVGAAFPILAALGILLGESVAALGDGNGHLGTFTDATRRRLHEWPFAFGFVLAFNGPVALAAFCAGLGAARRGFFEPGADGYAALRRRWPVLLGVGLSLSAYVAEGVVAGLVFEGHGLGLHGRVGDAACLGIALAIYALVHALADLWWRALGQGPLGRLLRAAARAGVPRTRGAGFG